MVSTKFIGIGTTIFVIGALSIGLYKFGIIPNPNVFTAGAGIALLGVVFMILGVISLAGSEIMPKEGIREGDSAAFSIGLIRCMLAISIADDHLDDTEITQIAKIYHHLTTAEISEEIIRETAAEMQEYGIDIQKELRTVAPSLKAELKEKLIIASLYILMADGDMDEDELIMLDDIRLGLGVSLKQVDKIQKNFMKNRTEPA